MRKNYTKMFLILCLGLISISSFAQGTWQAIKPDPTPGATITVGTELGFGITGLTAMNSASEGVTQKSDAGAPTDGIFTNEGILQANTSNANFYAFKTASDGVLKVACKLGASKPLFAYELAETDLATAATSGNTIGNGYGTDVVATLSDGSSFTEGITFTATTYTTLTFNVKAGKIYAIGCTGSKLMLRGVNYVLSSASGVFTPIENKKSFSFQNPAKGNLILQMEETANIGIYNTVGALMIQKQISPSDNTVDVSALSSGVYFIKDANNEYKTQKLIVE
jgi:hypothetical protein